MATLQKAFALYLGGHWEPPVITNFQLGILLFRLYGERTLGDLPVDRITKPRPKKPDLNSLVGSLLDVGVLTPHANFAKGKVFRILGKKPDAESDVLCAVDPFAVMSHLSAMEYHGLTDLIPKVLYYSTPPPAEWRKLGRELVEKRLHDDASEYISSGMPIPTPLPFDRIDRALVNRHATRRLGSFKKIRGGLSRVTTVGRTFLDMLQHPHLCGGVQHVLDAFETHGEEYLTLVIEEVQRHGTGIDKVRAGYILEERMGVRDDRIDLWREFIKRGGSRKLDPRNDYDGVNISENWCLSINL